MIQSALAGWLLRHWKGLVAALAALALLLVMGVSIGAGGLIAGAAAEEDAAGVDPLCVTGSGSPLEVDARDLTPKQRQVVGDIVRAGRDAGAPEHGIVIALAVAYQEGEAWTTPDYGDDAGPDSVGDFQQRDPWGPRADRLDTYKAATLFFTSDRGPGLTGLLNVPDWEVMAPSRAGNAVQRSAFPDAYAKHMARAQAALAATRTAAPAPTASAAPVADACVPVTPAEKANGVWPAEAMGPDNLKPRTARVRALIEQTFGETNIGGYSYRFIAGSNNLSDHATGNAVDIMLEPATDPARIAQGNRITDWCIANWDALAIKYLIYRDRWTSDGKTWRLFSRNDHYDHIHISVH